MKGLLVTSYLNWLTVLKKGYLTDLTVMWLGEIILCHFNINSVKVFKFCLVTVWYCKLYKCSLPKKQQTLQQSNRKFCFDTSLNVTLHMYAYMTVVLSEFYIIVAQNTWYVSSVRKQNHKRVEKHTNIWFHDRCRSVCGWQTSFYNWGHIAHISTTVELTYM